MSGPLPGVLAPVTIPMSWIWGVVVAARDARWSRGGTTSAGVPVISVGNLVVGGTGKTPMTSWIVSALQAMGHRPVIAMRGYGARAGVASDEALEHARWTPDVPVLVDPDRAGALDRFLPAHPEIDCCVLDDGFQHRRLRRELDLVLVDAARPALGDRLMPAGRLREPPSSLRRADAVIVTRASAIDEALANEIQRHHGRPPIAWARHAWSAVRVLDGDGERLEAPGWLAGRRVATRLGVGHPEAALAQVVAAGATVIDEVAARDHEPLTPPAMRRLARRVAGADALVMTGKDWVSAGQAVEWSDWSVPIAVPIVAIEFLDGADSLRARLETCVGSPGTPA